MSATDYAYALNQRFLSGLIAPEGEKLIVLKAPKGTGKTQWLSQEVAKAHDQGRRVLIITHRTFAIVNNYQSVSGNCYNYSGSNPKNLIAALDGAIAKGGHHLLDLSENSKARLFKALRQNFDICVKT